MENMSIRCNGFTLVELLVAMAVSGIVAAAIFTVFKSQQDSYIVQEDVAAMQQNLRAGMSMLSHDVRMAGFGLPSGQVSWYDNTGASPVTGYIKGISISNNNPDQIDIIYADPRVYTTLNSNSLTSDPTADLDVKPINELKKKFNGKLVIITDGNNASLLEITGVDVQGSKLQHDSGAGSINPPSTHNIFPSGGYASGSDVYKARYVSYRISTNDPLHPTLAVSFKGPNGAYQPLANNIEDMELVYIFDDGGEATAYDDTDADLTNDYDDIRAIRITLLARADRPDRNFRGNRPQIEDRAAGGIDGYRRRMLCSTVKIRNMGL